MKNKFKKFKYYIIIAVVFVLIVVFLLSAVSKNEHLVKKNLSEVRNVLYVCQSEEFVASFSCGDREDPYYYDGITNSMKPFGLLTVIFKDNKGYENIDFCISISGEEYCSQLEKNPFNQSFMCDIEKKFSENETITLKIIECTEVAMICLSKNFKINYIDAIRIACKYMDAELKELTKNNSLDGECYIKITTDESMSSDEYFWIFSIVGQNNKTYSCVIKVDSGVVLIKRVS